MLRQAHAAASATEIGLRERKPPRVNGSFKLRHYQIVEPLGRPRGGDDLHFVAFEIEAAVDEQLSEQNAGLTGSADAETLQFAHVALTAPRPARTARNR